MAWSLTADRGQWQARGHSLDDFDRWTVHDWQHTDEMIGHKPSRLHWPTVLISGHVIAGMPASAAITGELSVQ